MRLIVKAWVLIVCILMFSTPTALAEHCNGDFDFDGDVDGTDAYKFKLDFFRFDCNCPALVPNTGQTLCYDTSGNPRECAGTSEDGEHNPSGQSPSEDTSG